MISIIPWPWSLVDVSLSALIIVNNLQGEGKGDIVEGRRRGERKKERETVLE